MAERTKGKEVFRPYARLITILGDQLITNKIVAINEIVKNSYDADASEVTVRFINFEYFGKPKNEIPKGKEPLFELEDDGDGMSIDIIRNVWLQPATPIKLSKWEKKGVRMTRKGRIMQGEKGIGRFAMHKLGEDITIYTRAKGKDEAYLKINFGEYDQEKQLHMFLDQDKKMEYKYLDEIYNTWEVHKQPKKINKNGTLIQIRGIREEWSQIELGNLDKSFNNLITPIIPKEDKDQLNLSVEIVKDFNVGIEVDGRLFKGFTSKITFEKIAFQTPFKFIGTVSSKGVLSYQYESRLGRSRTNIDSFNMLNSDKTIILKPVEDRFFEYDKKKNERRQIRTPKCGKVKFVLYGFDLMNKAKWKAKKDERDFILNNNVFLYRDGVRVYPYGNPGNDWLELGKRRSEERAGFYFSNNDLVGFIFISHNENKLLKDASNREGIMDQEGAFEDFRALIIGSVMVMKYESDIDKAKEIIEKHEPIKLVKNSVISDFKKLVKRLENIDDKDMIDAANKYLSSSKNYVEEMNRRVEIYEDLAGLGIAVEKGSHDSLSIMNKMVLNLEDIKKRLKKQEIDKQELIQLIGDLEDNTYFLYEQLQIIEPLLRFEKRNEQEISINENAIKVVRYFRYELENYGIKVNIECEKDIKIVIGTGLLLQVLINLMDNAVYWLRNKGIKGKMEIVIRINSDNSEIIFADNGPGIEERVQPYIFMEFFTRKQEAKSRGLGLFIAKEILDRLGATIEVIQSGKDKLLPGANFKITLPK
ncbi:Adaptive-response sensory-kinase SasA [subsurface metagenome]